jgi:hypothetical protein
MDYLGVVVHAIFDNYSQICLESLRFRSDPHLAIVDAETIQHWLSTGPTSRLLLFSHGVHNWPASFPAFIFSLNHIS